MVIVDRKTWSGWQEMNLRNRLRRGVAQIPSASGNAPWWRGAGRADGVARSESASPAAMAATASAMDAVCQSGCGPVPWRPGLAGSGGCYDVPPIQ